MVFILDKYVEVVKCGGCGKDPEAAVVLLPPVQFHGDTTVGVGD